MTLSEEFVGLYNQLDRYLRTKANLSPQVPFSQVVDAVYPRDAATRAFARDLKEFAELRNAIVHDARRLASLPSRTRTLSRSSGRSWQA